MDTREWKSVVVEKVKSYNDRKSSIANELNLLTQVFNHDQSESMFAKLVDEQNLVWEVRVGVQKFLISEGEISTKQKIELVDNDMNVIETCENRGLRETIQDIIIEKLK